LLLWPHRREACQGAQGCRQRFGGARTGRTAVGAGARRRPSRAARNLNRKIEIIARGDAVSTERKLVHAGANKVVLPTHIGAERIAEIILFPETARFVRESDQMRELERTLRNLGLSIEVIVVPEHGALTGLSIADIEARAAGVFFVVQLNRRNGDNITAPGRETRIEAGDGVVVVGRSSQAINALFAAPRQTARGGRL
jgi:Trk K+ transport system NAD-binding subunit